MTENPKTLGQIAEDAYNDFDSTCEKLDEMSWEAAASAVVAAYHAGVPAEKGGCNICGEPTHMGCCNPARPAGVPPGNPTLTWRELPVDIFIGPGASAGAAICGICKGGGHVCENHEDKTWPGECDCGAGMPCRCCLAIPQDGAHSIAEAFASAPYALTDQHVRALEAAIRAEGYRIMIDPDGKITLEVAKP